VEKKSACGFDKTLAAQIVPLVALGWSGVVQERKRSTAQLAGFALANGLLLREGLEQNIT